MRLQTLTLATFAAAFAMGLSGAPALAAVTGNLLVNPGAETGLSPWTLGLGTSVTGPRSLSGGAIDATEGSAWFFGDVELTNEGSGTHAAGGVGFRQLVDVRPYSGIQSVTYGLDYFGIGEMLDGTGELRLRGQVTLLFRDSSLTYLDFSQSYDSLFGHYVNTPFYLNDHRATAPLPAGTAYIEFTYSVEAQVQNYSAEEPATGHFLVGADDLYLSLQLVPEPSALVLASAGCAALLAIARRRRISLRGAPLAQAIALTMKGRNL